MTPEAARLRGYEGLNPFSESQARNYSDEKIVSEFFPISLYWSLFNDQHEVLLGTRGSGKTVILRMLSYSCLRRFSHPTAEDLKHKKRFIGFYIPLHLEFLASLEGRDVPDEKRLEYFQFAVNCSAAASLLHELKALLHDQFPSTDTRLGAEKRVISYLERAWFPEASEKAAQLDDLERFTNAVYRREPFWSDGDAHTAVGLSGRLLLPIVDVLPTLSSMLELDTDATRWLCCLDEAEFLTDPFICCINEFMRSEKRPVTLKVATLPFKYQTRETLTRGVSVEPGGNDFNFRLVDLPSRYKEFSQLTDHILATRLCRIDESFANTTLEAFLGRVGRDRPIDYFAGSATDAESEAENRLKAILKSLSAQRRSHYQMIKDDSELVESSYLRRYSPVYYVRRMKELDSQANRKVGWFAGARTARRVADGNPRRFIQIAHDLVEVARKDRLTATRQHEIISKFARRQLEIAAGLPDFGRLLKEILESVGKMLADRIHGRVMLDGGCGFSVDSDVLDSPMFRDALILGLAYSYLFCDDRSMHDGISCSTEFRVAYLSAVKHWITMRKGDPPKLMAGRQLELPDTQRSALEMPVSTEASTSLLRQLDLFLEEDQGA